MLFALMQLLGGIILSVGWIPQIMQIIRTKSVADLSLNAYLLMLLGIGLMEAYALRLAADGTGLAFLITNTLSLAVVSIVVLLILRYRLPRSPKNNPYRRTLPSLGGNLRLMPQLAADLLHQIQPHPCRFLKRTPVHSGKISIKHPRQVTGRNAHPFIAHLKHHLPLLCSIPVKMDESPLLNRVPERISYQLGQHKAKPLLV